MVMVVESKTASLRQITKVVRRVLDHPIADWRAEDLTYQKGGLRLGDVLFPYGLYAVFAGRRTAALDTNDTYNIPARVF